MEPVSVNGVVIDEEMILAEAEGHPPPASGDVRQSAVRSLVVRELLLQEARRLGFRPAPLVHPEAGEETDESSLIRQLCSREIPLQEPDDAACRAFYEQNRARMRSPDVVEASHILFAASPDDETAYGAAAAQATAAIAELQREPGRFAEMAQTLSACPSGKNGGRLGKIAQGQTVPEFEMFLFRLDSGELCAMPVKTRFGVHVVRADQRTRSAPMPFEAVRERIAQHLGEQSMYQGLHLYVQSLVSRADIRGIDVVEAFGVPARS
jgi:peptidyl-prolyl cis-trans isomerase C